MVTNIASRVPTNFCRNMPLVYRYILLGVGGRTTWTLEIPVEGPYCLASSVGEVSSAYHRNLNSAGTCQNKAYEELCPTSAVNRSVTLLLGAP